MQERACKISEQYSLNPEQVTNYLRLQPIITNEIKKANDLLEALQQNNLPIIALNAKALVKLTLTFLEIGDWNKVVYFCNIAGLNARREHASQFPSSENDISFHVSMITCDYAMAVR